MALDPVTHQLPVPAEGQVTDHPCGEDPGHGADPFEDGLVLRLLLHVDPRDQPVLGTEAGVDSDQAAEALGGESGPDHQHHREGHLRDHQGAPELLAGVPDRAAGPGAERAVEIARGGANDRHHAEEEPGEHRDPERECQHQPVHPDRVGPGQLGAAGHGEGSHRKHSS